jgi:protein-S-isoprenylcysteine O-methyltransferase Ste14
MDTAPFIRAYAVVAYAVTVGVLSYAVGFIADHAVPVSINHGPHVTWPAAAVIDLVLLLVFAVQHTVMARSAVKRHITRILPAAAERSTFVLCASLALALLYWQWRPITATIWSVHGAAAVAFWLAYGTGWVIAVAATFMISHADLFGLRQAWLVRTKYEPPSFTTRGAYRIVRHPLMTGFVIVFWSTPTMTAGHLLFALAGTGYILAGIWFEERDLNRDLGQVYASYRARVPALVPGIRPRSRPEDPVRIGGML